MNTKTCAPAPESAANTPEPLVSVIITCYNQGQWLHEAIQSILDSTWKSLEILVYDDGSTDPATIAAFDGLEARFPKTRLFHQRNQGVSLTRNRGLHEANGEFILFLDGDDRIAPDYLASAMALFARRPDTCVVTGDFCVFQDGEEPSGQKALHWETFNHAAFITRGGIPVTSLFRKTMGLRIGGFSRVLNRIAGEDFDFWLSLYEKNPNFQFIPAVCLYYRHHGVSRNGHNPKRLFSRVYQILHHPRLYLSHPGAFVSVFTDFMLRRLKRRFSRKHS